MVNIWKAIALLITVGLLTVMASAPALANDWVMVAQSEKTHERQYVDPNSIEVLEQTEGTPTHIRLKTSWGFQDSPDSLNVATTEYLCQQGQYRDVVVNNKTTGDRWQPLGADPLNRAAMEYGCHKNTP